MLDLLCGRTAAVLVCWGGTDDLTLCMGFSEGLRDMPHFVLCLLVGMPHDQETFLWLIWEDANQTPNVRQSQHGTHLPCPRYAKHLLSLHRDHRIIIAAQASALAPFIAPLSKLFHDQPATRTWLRYNSTQGAMLNAASQGSCWLHTRYVCRLMQPVQSRQPLALLLPGLLSMMSTGRWY